MVPVIGMKFGNPIQLKLCVTNYAVKNEYDLWYEKSDHNRLLVKCCKGKKNKNNKGCPFRLWSYGKELRRTNPGATVKIDVDVMPDGTTYFLKFYVCLKDVKDAWIQGCRRVIGLDGCFLKGIYRVESKETWKWFVDLILDDIEMGNGHEMVPAAKHRARHICANFLKNFKGQQCNKLFWYAAASTTQAKFEQHMNEIKKFWRVVPSGYQEFEARLGYDAYSIDLGRKTCTSRAWLLTGYPCVHAYAAISNLNRDPEDYVSPLLTTTMFGKVKVELTQEVDVASDSDSDNEVQMEPDSEVESYEVDFEEDIHRYEDVDQREATVEVQGQGEGQEGEELAILQDPIGPDDQGQDAVQDLVEEEHMQEVPAFQILQGKRRRKPSERIMKIQIRKKWEGKQWSSGENLMELE
ncbi:unnamed protein product [Lactuca saligna]|uniref:SWIM-type domain-containing protein n=1 Tax=Lactuca saligna TaxID=75948 RepID=A0AA35ZVR5_LACSI|nr:unnamed protein product [Lactuca saligna]